MNALGWFLFGGSAGALVALTACAVGRVIDVDDRQVPLLMPGVWLIDIDPTGDCVAWVRQPVDIASAAERLIRLHDPEGDL